MNLTKLFILTCCLSFTVSAADITYKRGQDKTYVASCVNPTERVDGTPLSPDEIAEVIYYVSNGATSLLTINMNGGCTDTTIDLQQFPSNTELGTYAKTIDIDGLESVVSAGLTFIIQNANPNAPGHIQ